MFKQLLFVVAYYFIDVICTTCWYSSENCLDITHSEIDSLKWLDCKNLDYKTRQNLSLYTFN